MIGKIIASMGRAAIGNGNDAPIRMSFSFDGETVFDRVMLGIQAAVTDLSEPYEQLADHFTDVLFPKAFRAIDQEGYKDVESGYVKYKKAILGMGDGANDPPVLRWVRVRTDRPGPNEILYPSFVKKTDPDHVREIKPTSMKIGSSVPWAEDHHRGTGRGPKQFGSYPLPKRELVRVDNGDFRDIDRIFQRYLDSIGKIQGRA